MKIAYVVDKKIDQSEVESKYLWHLEEIYRKTIWSRINLSTISIDFNDKSIGESRYIQITTSLPNNQLYGMKIDGPCKMLFISNENLNMKIVKSSIYDPDTEAPIAIGCFYDDSIYTFQASMDIREYKNYYDDPLFIKFRLEKYSIKNNSWTTLATPPDLPNSFTAMNQKIIFSDLEHRDGLWVYDISVNSYTYHSPIRFDSWTSIQWLTKHDGKLYLFAASRTKRIYCCDDPLSDWNIISHFDKDLISAKIYARFLGHYEGSNYFLKDRGIYKFDLEDLKIKRVGFVSFRS